MLLFNVVRIDNIFKSSSSFIGCQQKSQRLTDILINTQVPKIIKAKLIMSRKPLPTWCFGLVVVRHPETKKYLLVHETGNRGWWLPGGRVEPGESFEVGAVRECKEEAGVDVELKGVLRVEFTPGGSSEENASGRMRLIFYAEPIDPNQSKKYNQD